MRVSVIVPSYRRAEDLRRCLGGFAAQTAPAEQTLVAHRRDDEATRDCAVALGARPVPVDRPGVAAAMDAALDQADGDVLSITDDDAVPRPDWLARVRAHFEEDGRLGALGGRDWIHRRNGDVEAGAAEPVGLISWFGRNVGNHHLGAGAAREVDHLKGVNMSFRREAVQGLRFDDGLRGSGAQVHVELAYCLAVKRRGWRVVYDPQTAVDHYCAPRVEGARLEDFTPEPAAAADAAFNEALALWRHLSPAGRVAYGVWAALVGTRLTPGLLQAVRFTPARGLRAWRYFWSAQRGIWEALGQAARERR